jgi:hypothetical protein
MEIVEWPGGEPIDLDLAAPTDEFNRVTRGATFLSLTEPVDLAEMAAVPWFSTACLGRTEDEDLSDEKFEQAPWVQFVTGPARFKNGHWCLPIYEQPSEGEEWDHHIGKLRARGFNSRYSDAK